MLKFYNYDIVFQEVPDQVSLAVNITDCPNHCPGCHSTYLQQDIGSPLSEQVIDVLLERYGRSITCWCFMGGDAQPEEVDRLAGYVHQVMPNLKIAWYSGRSALSQEVNPKHFNYIKLGPYVQEKGGLRKQATNQRLYEVSGGQLIDITSKFWNL